MYIITADYETLRADSCRLPLIVFTALIAIRSSSGLQNLKERWLLIISRFLFSHVLLSPVIVSGSLPLCWWLSGDSSFQLITLICISVWLLWSWR